ncbi:MAG: hypothetical protein V4606_02100 [Patescibacteria group bacterium]
MKKQNIVSEHYNLTTDVIFSETEFQDLLVNLNDGMVTQRNVNFLDKTTQLLTTSFSSKLSPVGANYAVWDFVKDFIGFAAYCSNSFTYTPGTINYELQNQSQAQKELVEWGSYLYERLCLILNSSEDTVSSASISQTEVQFIFTNDDTLTIKVPLGEEYSPRKTAKQLLKILLSQPAKMEAGVKVYEEMPLERLISKLDWKNHEFVYDKENLNLNKLTLVTREIQRQLNTKRIPLKIKIDKSDIWLRVLPLSDNKSFISRRGLSGKK